MDDVPTGFIFQTIDERQTVDSSKIVWLAAGSRVKRRLVENDAEPVADGPGLYDVRVELKQVRIVVVKPLGFHSGLIHARRRRRYMVHIQGPLSRDIPVNIDLDDMRSRTVETYICEEGHVIRIAIVFDGKFRRHRDHDLFAIGRQDLHVRLELPVADPMVHDRELQQRRREGLKEDVLEQSHQ